MCVGGEGGEGGKDVCEWEGREDVCVGGREDVCVWEGGRGEDVCVWEGGGKDVCVRGTCPERSDYLLLWPLASDYPCPAAAATATADGWKTAGEKERHAVKPAYNGHHRASHRASISKAV